MCENHEFLAHRRRGLTGAERLEVDNKDEEHDEAANDNLAGDASAKADTLCRGRDGVDETVLSRDISGRSSKRSKTHQAFADDDCRESRETLWHAALCQEATRHRGLKMSVSEPASHGAHLTWQYAKTSRSIASPHITNLMTLLVLECGSARTTKNDPRNRRAEAQSVPTMMYMLVRLRFLAYRMTEGECSKLLNLSARTRQAYLERIRWRARGVS